MNDQTVFKHGGKREGAGRKVAGTEYVKIRLTPAQRTKLTELGGSAYLQNFLQNNMNEKKITLNLSTAQADILRALGDEWIDRQRAEIAEVNRRGQTLFVIDYRDGELVIDSVGNFEQKYCNGMTYQEWRDRGYVQDDLEDFLDSEDAIDFAKNRLQDLLEENAPDNENKIENLQETIDILKNYIDDFQPVTEIEAIGIRLASLANQRSDRVIEFTIVDCELTDVRVEFVHIAAERLNLTEREISNAVYDPNIPRSGDYIEASPADDREFCFYASKEDAFKALERDEDEIEPEEYLKFRQIIDSFPL